MNIPEISVQTLQTKMKSDEKFVLLDVREFLEIEKVKLNDPRLIILPMSQLVQKGLQSFPEKVKNIETEIIVICHHGIRSAQVTNWLTMQGWKNVFSLHGGVDAYAKEIDSSIGFY